MDRPMTLSDCPECRGVRTVILDVCYVCFAEFGEGRRYVVEDDLIVSAQPRASEPGRGWRERPRPGTVRPAAGEGVRGIVTFQVIPRERAFYDLLETDGEGVASGARELRALIADFEHADEHRRRIHELEGAGDDLTHSVIALLNRTFVTPVDRQDIHHLASYLDDVLDSIEAVADLLVLHRIREPIPQLRMQADVLVGASEAVARAIRGLRSFRTVDRAWVDIVRFERDGDHVYRMAVAELYSGGFAAMDVLKWRDVLEEMEAAIDRCEDVANTLETISLKYA